MQVKAIKGDKEYLYSCTHVIKETVPTGSGTMQIRLCGADPGVPSLIRIPADADRVYVTADGKTIGNYPPAVKSTNGEAANV